MSEFGKIILEIEGKDTSGSSVLKQLRTELESLVSTYKNALSKIGAEFEKGGQERSSRGKKLTEEERKELEAQIRMIKDNNAQIKADYKLLTEAKVNADKSYIEKYLQNAKAQSIAQKQLIQDDANQSKQAVTQKLNETIALNQTISSLERKTLEESAKNIKLSIQEKATLEMKAIDAKFKNEVKEINDLVRENKRLQQEIQAEEIARAKISSQIIKDFNKKTLQEQKDAYAEINKQMAKDFEDSIKRSTELQNQELEKRKAKARLINDDITKDFIRGVKEAQQAQKDAYNAPIKDKTMQISSSGLNLGDLRFGISQLEQLKQTVKGTDQASKEFKNTLQININKYREQAVAVEEQIRALLREREALKGNTGALATNNQSIKENIEELKLQRQLISGVTEDTRRQTDSYGNMGGVIWQTRAALHAFLDTLNLLINSPFVEWSKQVDVNFQNMNSIVFLGAEQMKALKQEVYDLINSEGAVGIEDVSKSLFALSSAGYKGADAMKILKESVKTASASLETTEDTLKSTISTLKTYGYTADQARRVQNTFMVGVQDGIFTMKELNQYVGQAISLASEFKDVNGQSAVSIEQVTAALVGTTLQGVNMANSVTAINQVFKTFLDPTEGASVRAKQLGIDLSYTAFQSKNLGEVIVDVMEKTGGNEGFLADLFGNIRALKGVFKLAKDDSKQFIDSYAKLEEQRQMIDEDGKIARDKSQKEQEESFQSHLDRVKNKFGLFMVQTGELAFAGLKPLVKMLESVITWFNNLAEPTRTLIQGIILTVFTIGTLIATLVTLSITFQIVQRAMLMSLPLLGSIGIVSTTSATGVTALSFSFAALGKSLLLLMAQAILLTATLWGVYSIIEGIDAYNKQRKAEQEQAENEKRYTDQLSESAKKVRELLDLEQERFQQGKKLTEEENRQLARSMAVASTDDKTSKALGFDRQSLREEAQARGKALKESIDAVQITIKKKEKLTKEGLDRDEKIFTDYENNAKKHRDDIQKDILSKYENEKREINDSFNERLAFFQNTLDAEARTRDKSRKFSKEEREEILKNISDLKTARTAALKKAYDEEQNRLREKAKSDKADKDAKVKDEQKRARDEMNSKINALDKLINEEKAKTQKSMGEKLAMIENYLSQQAVIYDKYSKNTIFLPGERSQLAEKSSAKTTQIATERKKLEDKSINESLVRSKLANDIRIKQIENRGVLENQAEEDILTEKAKAYNDYSYELQGILDRDLKYTILTEEKKLEIESNLAESKQKKTEAIKAKNDLTRAKELNQREFNLNQEKEGLELFYKLDMVSFEEYQSKKETLRQIDLANVRKDIAYEKKANGGRQVELNNLYEKEAKLLNDNDLAIKESFNFRLASDKTLYESKIQYYSNLRQLGIINDFEERSLIRSKMEGQIFLLEEQLSKETDAIKKAKLEREKEGLQIAIKTSLEQDSQKIFALSDQVLNATTSMLTQIEAVAKGSAKLFLGVSREIIDISSKVTSNIGKIASGDVAGGIIGLTATGIESVVKLFTSINDQVTNFQASSRDRQKAILESEKDTTAKRIKLIQEQSKFELEEIEKLSDRTIYDAMVKADKKKALEIRTNTELLSIQKEFQDKLRDLDNQFFEAQQASKTDSQIKEESLSKRTGTLVSRRDRTIVNIGKDYNLTDEQIANIRKGGKAITNEELSFQKELFVIGQNFLNDKAKLEEEFRDRRIVAQKYEGKITRIFNEEQNESELKKLEEKYKNEVEYINNTFAEHEGKSKMLADLKIEYERAITTVTIEENKKRTKALSEGQDEILKGYKEQKKLLDDMYKEESNRIDKSIDDIRKKYTAESDRIREITKLLGQDKVDEELNKTVNIIYNKQRDKLISEVPGSFYRQTDEEFTESIKKRENSLKDAVLGGLSFDDRLKEEQAIALTKVAYLTEYKDKFRITSREYTEAEVNIRIEKERFFELEKEKIKKDFERIALINEKQQREANAKELATQYEKEIVNARTLEQNYNQSALNLQSALEKTRASFSNGMINVVNDFGVGMFKVANDFASQLALKLGEKLPSLNIATNTTSSVVKYETSTTPRQGESYDAFIQRIKMEDVNTERKRVGLPPLQFANGGISEGSKSGYAITAHGRELHLNENQSDNLAYLFKLANMGSPTNINNAGINTSNSSTNVSVVNNFSGMKISSDMDLQKVTAHIEKSIDKKLKRVM